MGGEEGKTTLIGKLYLNLRLTLSWKCGIEIVILFERKENTRKRKALLKE